MQTYVPLRRPVARPDVAPPCPPQSLGIKSDRAESYAARCHPRGRPSSPDTQRSSSGQRPGTAGARGGNPAARRHGGVPTSRRYRTAISCGCISTCSQHRPASCMRPPGRRDVTNAKHDPFRDRAPGRWAGPLYATSSCDYWQQIDRAWNKTYSKYFQQGWNQTDRMKGGTVTPPSIHP